MKYHIFSTVRLANGIPGVVCDTAPAIKAYYVEPWYEVNWVDGNRSIHAESELYPITQLRAANDDVY